MFAFRALRRVLQTKCCVNCGGGGYGRVFSSTFKDRFQLDYQLDRDYYLSPDNRDEILHNIRARKLAPLIKQLDQCNNDQEITKFLEDNLVNLPVRLEDNWLDYDPEEKENIDNYVLEEINRLDGSKKTKKAVNLGRSHGLLYTSRYDNLGQVGISKSYFLFGDLARLHQAVIDWTLDILIDEHDFIPVSVPNLAYESVIKACGYVSRGRANQVFKLLGTNVENLDMNHQSQDKQNPVCLVGTAEIPLAAMHMGEVFQHEDLPRKYCAVSRCYRAETGKTTEDSGIFRVPYFSKVEMFAFTAEDQSDYVLNEFVLLQKDLYSRLGFRFRLIDIPPPDLGTNAARKFDYEGWFPGPLRWGEISSASNCKDYQARRLNLKYKSLNPDAKESNEPFVTNFVHTVNATACALPRVLSLILECGQDSGTIHIPVCLQPYMNGQETLQNVSDLFLTCSSNQQQQQ
ncbi:uncharacterized protein LOC141856983 [Brevipalpus obovatus]|uniref:uncharacterized protein LOC141856983 n=1 Tax=Brevipalpus obovatus TaxID=246614 RepID=UPI003D9F71A6